MSADCACPKLAERNVDYPWDEFDPEEYLTHNYAELRDDDREILEFVSSFFVEAFRGNEKTGTLRAIDVGTGANLYPAMAMLPFCSSITLYEYSQSNVDWLRREHADGWPSWHRAWDKFWTLLCKQETYSDFSVNPNAELWERTEVVHGSVFDLGSDQRRWDLGTMFFVAESITQRRTEFTSAVDHFLDALAPNAPFAIAFMEHSGGYHVADKHFPATDIGSGDVHGCLDDRAVDVELLRVETGDKPLRDGYSGMIIACGRVKDRTGT